MATVRTDDYIVSGSTKDTWVIWNNDYITSSTTASVTPDPWPIWVRSSGTATTTVNGSTTSATRIITADSSAIVWESWTQHYRISNEEFRAREERRERQRQESIRIEGERKAARERAQILLRESLSEAQREELANKGYFSLQSIARDGRIRNYRIRQGQVRNIQEVDASGRILSTICAHPRMRVPDEDAMLIQKLMLESQDGHDDFLRIANVSRHG